MYSRTQLPMALVETAKIAELTVFFTPERYDCRKQDGGEVIREFCTAKGSEMTGIRKKRKKKSSRAYLNSNAVVKILSVHLQCARCFIWTRRTVHASVLVL